MKTARKRDQELIEEIVGRLAGRHSTAVVLFHQAVAERLGLGPTDHKCLDLLRERGGSPQERRSPPANLPRSLA